eukprot:TRINITY_DN49444_c0_g1_i1.p1 TRINITY_DN49444_c0_g1~~TRINITY_DN49444_c0_g1_i1.p1  ORF type:complete len:290 (-),score=68.61 TRINITY_DN49444_c0_g1_i1:108-977(-)
MATAGETRERSRSPRRVGAETAPPAEGSPSSQDAAASKVPAHWLKAAEPADKESTPAASEPAGGKKGGKGGKKGFHPAHSKFDAADEAEETVSAPGVSATELLALATEVESELASAAKEAEDSKSTAAGAAIARVPEVLRRTAARLGALEKSSADMGATLRAINLMSGRGMTSIVGGLPGADPVDMDVAANDGPRSFLHKKGDEDVQELHRVAAQQRPTGGSSSAGGALSAVEKTKEEMDAARKARLERLEAQQGAKQKEQAEAAIKSRAKEALFNSSMVGPAKPIGRL